MSLALLQDCLLDVGDWKKSSKFKLNPDKREVLLFVTKLHRKEFMKHFPAKLLDHEITPTDSVEISESVSLHFEFQKTHIIGLSLLSHS